MVQGRELRLGNQGIRVVYMGYGFMLRIQYLLQCVLGQFRLSLPEPSKEGKIMAQTSYKAIILHTFGVQAGFRTWSRDVVGSELAD